LGHLLVFALAKERHHHAAREVGRMGYLGNAGITAFSFLGTSGVFPLAVAGSEFCDPKMGECSNSLKPR
jgi:hypothetical protein